MTTPRFPRSRALAVASLLLAFAAAPGWSQAPPEPAAADPSPHLTVTLDELVRAAAEFYPRRREQQARQESAVRRLATLEARFRPELAVQAQAAYHSEVAVLPAGVGASPPKDQYAVVLEADQRLWDGGRTVGEKALEEAARDIDLAAVEVDFFGWRRRIEEAYFRILSSYAEQALLATLSEDLAAQGAVLAARVTAGVALAGDRAVLEAEFESQRQRIVEIVAERAAALELLSALTGRDLPADVELVMPTPQPPADLLAVARSAAEGVGVGRAEMDQARATKRWLAQRVELAALADKPLITAFGQAGVGRPADQNFFEQDPTPFFVLGLRLRWQPFDWGNAQREEEVRRLDQEVSASRLATFLDSLSAGLRQLARRIAAAEDVLAADDRIVTLRQQSSRQAVAQLRGGVITPSAYLLERNAEHRARLTREQHRLNQVRDTVEFITTLGVSP